DPAPVCSPVWGRRGAQAGRPPQCSAHAGKWPGQRAPARPARVEWTGASPDYLPPRGSANRALPVPSAWDCTRSGREMPCEEDKETRRQGDWETRRTGLLLAEKPGFGVGYHGDDHAQDFFIGLV